METFCEFFKFCHIYHKSDIRIIQDIRGMKEAPKKRVMKYIEALKQIEELENLE